MENEIIKELIENLQNKKLKNIEAFDLNSRSEIVKFIILATSNSEKSSRQISVELEKELIEKGFDVKKEGEFPGDWIVLDLGEILIEIFTEDSRKYYNLEKLWGSSKNKINQPSKRKRKVS